jgi:hypothetical protein
MFVGSMCLYVNAFKKSELRLKELGTDNDPGAEYRPAVSKAKP